MSSPFSPKSQVSKINCHVLFIDLSHDLGPARFPSRAPPHRGDGGDRQPLWQDGGQGSTSGAGRPVLPAPAMAQGCPMALEMPRLLPSCSLPAPFLPTPFLPCTAISPAVPALALISPLPQARRGCAQRASRFSFFLKLFLFRLSFLNLISR